MQFRRTGEAQVRIEQMEGERQASGISKQGSSSSAGQQQQASGETVDRPTGSIGSAAISEQDRERIGVMEDNQRAAQAARCRHHSCSRSRS